MRARQTAEQVRDLFRVLERPLRQTCLDPEALTVTLKQVLKACNNLAGVYDP